MVQNIGHDGSGIHCGKSDLFETEISIREKWEFTNNITEHNIARKRLEEYFKKIKPPLWRRLLRKVIPEEIKKIIKNISQ